MSNSEINSLIESVKREAEMHQVELDAVRHIEDEDSDVGITLRVLETDAENEADQVGFQVTKPNTQMGRQVFSERLSQGFRALSDHLRDGDDSNGEDSERQIPDEDASSEPEMTEDAATESTEPNTQPNSAPAPKQSQPTREVGSFSITTELDDDSLEALAAELDDTFDSITDELPDEERIDGLKEDIDDLDKRLSVLEEKLAMLGSFDGG